MHPLEGEEGTGGRPAAESYEGKPLLNKEGERLS